MLHGNITCCTDTGRDPKSRHASAHSARAGAVPRRTLGCADTTTFNAHRATVSTAIRAAHTGPGGHLVSDPDASITDTISRLHSPDEETP